MRRKRGNYEEKRWERVKARGIKKRTSVYGVEEKVKEEKRGKEE